MPSAVSTARSPHHITDVAHKALVHLTLDMTSPHSTPQPSGHERREFYRVTVRLPIWLQREGEQEQDDAPLMETSVNLSGGGFGILVTDLYKPNEILIVTLRLPEHGLFMAYAEVLRLDTLPAHADQYRLHARFIRLSDQDREILIRYITKFQRHHLQRHYLA